MFNCDVDTECGSDDQPDTDNDAHQSQSDDEMDIAIGQEWESARFLLKSTEEFSLTHNGVDRFCECIRPLSQGWGVVLLWASAVGDSFVGICRSACRAV